MYRDATQLGGGISHHYCVRARQIRVPPQLYACACPHEVLQAAVFWLPPLFFSMSEGQQAELPTCMNLLRRGPTPGTCAD
jgi:hypothetical protein